MSVFGKEKGFTLVELMIAMFLALAVMAAAYTVFEGSNRASSRQDMDNKMLDNARMAMDVLARAFRTAGFLVNFNSYPIGANGLIGGIPGANTKLTPSNFTTKADELYICAASLISKTSLRNTAPAGAVTIVVENSTGIVVGDFIGVGYTFTARVSAVAGNTLTLDTTGTPNAKLNMAYPGRFLQDGVTASNMQPTPVRLITRSYYSIDTASDAAHPTLRVLDQVKEVAPGQPVVEDIENIQIAYGVDRNNDRIIQASEWTNSPAVSDYDQIRLVRITVVARSPQPDRALVGKAQTIPANGAAIEDFPARTNVTDGYRRYILTRIIKCRNLDILFTL